MKNNTIQHLKIKEWEKESSKLSRVWRNFSKSPSLLINIKTKSNNSTSKIFKLMQKPHLFKAKITVKSIFQVKSTMVSKYSSIQ